MRVTLHDGSVFVRDKSDFVGFVTRPAGWPEVERKYGGLGGPDSIVELVRNLEKIEVSELCRELAGLGGGSHD